MRQTRGQENISTSKMNKEDKEMIFKKTTRRGTISGMRLKRDYPLFYCHETFAKHLIASQGANIPAHMCRSCAHRGMGVHGEVQQSIRGSEDRGNNERVVQSSAKGFGEREAVSEVRIDVQRCSHMFGVYLES
jgi:hypothetical protein